MKCEVIQETVIENITLEQRDFLSIIVVLFVLLCLAVMNTSYFRNKYYQLKGGRK